MNDDVSSYRIAIEQFSHGNLFVIPTVSTVTNKLFSENRLNKLKATGPPAPPMNEADADAAGMRRFAVEDLFAVGYGPCGDLDRYLSEDS